MDRSTLTAPQKRATAAIVIGFATAAITAGHSTDSAAAWITNDLTGIKWGLGVGFISWLTLEAIALHLRIHKSRVSADRAMAMLRHPIGKAR